MSWKRPPREEEGLMPQIMALLAPPSEFQESTPAENNLPNPHQYFKVPGKGHNRDLCDACGEGGDIICCDRCPASFHLLCHEPPLNEDQLPQEWVCRACCSKDPKPEMKNENNKKRGRIGVKNKEEAAPKIKQQKTVNGKCDIFEQMNGETQTDNEFKLSREFLCEKLEGIVNTTNAKSFSLSRQDVYLPKTAFPGESRRDPKKQFEVCDNGVVQKPFKVCFVCKKTCRRAALLSCDFCSLYYHLDCLDPPLAHIPSGLWMCPSHPHQFIEEKRLTSSRLSERLHYWDLLSKPVDHDEVQINFLRNGSRKFPPFRQKVRLAGKVRVQVPDAVKLQYEKKCALFSKIFDEDSLKAELDKDSNQTNQSEQLSMPIENNGDISGKNSFLPIYPSVFRTDRQPAASSSERGKLLKETRAFLVPVNSRMPSYPIDKSSIEVGTNKSSDLYLPLYGLCKYNSELHCVIFLDKLENVYELLNYSNFGTVVDGTNYVVGSDLKTDKNEVSEVQCKCGSPPSSKGWESSAVLKHGSVLNFGCVSFIFTLSSECTKLS